MDNSLRLQYLQAMGVDVWLPRSAQPAYANVLGQEPKAENDSPYALLDWPALRKIPAAECCCAIIDGSKNIIMPHGQQQDYLILLETEHDALTQEAELLLMDMLSAIGLKPEQVFITTVFSGFTITSDHHKQTNCRWFILRQAELIQPKIILAMGEKIAKNLLQTPATISDLRGVMHQLPVPPSTPTVLVTYGLTHLLDNALDKRLVWQDLQLVRSILNR